MTRFATAMARACVTALIALTITTATGVGAYAATPSAKPVPAGRTPAPSSAATVQRSSAGESASASSKTSTRLASPAAGPLTPGSGSGFGSHLQFWNSSTSFSIAVEGVESQSNLPAMSTWTIEGWMFDMSGTCNSNGADAAWGLLGGTLPQASYSAPVAGIDFSPTAMQWRWPGGSASLAG